MQLNDEPKDTVWFDIVCNQLYTIKNPNKMNGGFGEVMLASILPGAAKSSDTGDIIINGQPCEVKGLYNISNKYCTAKLNGANTDAINITKNKNCLQMFINEIKNNIYNKNNNIKNEDINKLDELKNNLAAFNMGIQNISNGFDICFKIIQKLNIPINTINFILKESLKQIFNNKDLCENMAKTLISAITTNDIINKNISVFKAGWPRIWGIYTLKYYMIVENSKYFICCLPNNQIDIFNADKIRNSDYEDLSKLFKNYIFQTPNFQGKAGQAAAASIKYNSNLNKE